MRVFLLVIDSLGIGALPDASHYGDEGSHTVAGIGREAGPISWPNLKAMGLGNAALLTGESLIGCPAIDAPTSLNGVARERSPGKDTSTGHWEMAGIVLEKAFPVFPADPPSFPERLIGDFIRLTGVPGILGDKAASGTAIIEELGEEHLETGKPICYTSADSVFQIAAHSSKYPIAELYRFCEIARELCNGYNIGRVIARPFDGRPGTFRRTSERHDWSIDLPGPCLMDYLREGGVQTVAVGKIGSIFNEQGIDISHHDAGNEACLKRTLELAREPALENQFVFVNLVDTDMIYGHRRDPKGYHDAVAVIDAELPRLESLLNRGDVILITGDHGCDPTFRGSDHTREHVPILLRRVGFSPFTAENSRVGIRESFADISASIQKLFGMEARGPGMPFV